MTVSNLYICAASHSGSTLLDLLLGSHSRVMSLGELTHLPKNLALNTECTCGEPVQSCPVWTAILKDASNRLRIDISSDPYELDLGHINASRVIDRKQQNAASAMRRKITHATLYALRRAGLTATTGVVGRLGQGSGNKIPFYDAVRAATGRSVVVDSSKHYLEAVELYLRDPESTRILQLSRDGRAVFYSSLKRGVDRSRALEAWQRPASRGERVIRQHVPSAHRLSVRYEDLARQPEQTLREICDFAELEWEPGMLNFGDHEHHIANGNNMRFSNASEIRYDAAWERELDEDSLAFFERRAGTLNRQLGYS